MSRVVSYEVQETVRNCAASPGSWNVIGSIYAVLQPQTFVALTEKLRRQRPSDNLG